MTHLHPRGTSRQQQRMWGTESHSAQPCVRQAVVPAPPKGGTLGTQASKTMCANYNKGPAHTHTRRTRGCHADSNMWGTEVHSALRTLGQAAQCASTALSKTAIENGNETSKQHSIQRLCDACGATRLPNMMTDMKYCFYVGLSCCCCGCDGCECCCLLVLLTSLITQNGKLAAHCARRGKSVVVVVVVVVISGCC